MKKKKKIRNLTKEEIDKLCDDNYDKYRSCYGCQLNTGAGMCIKYLDLDLDQEIEVEVEEDV